MTREFFGHVRRAQPVAPIDPDHADVAAARESLWRAHLALIAAKDGLDVLRREVERRVRDLEGAQAEFRRTVGA